MRSRQEAAWRQRGYERRQDSGRVVGVRDEVQDGQQHKRDGLGEVECLADRGIRQDLLRFTQVCLDVRGAARYRRSQQRASVRQDERIVVGVHNAAGGRDPLGDLMGVTGARQAGANVEKLPDTRFAGQVADRAREELPVLPGGDACHRQSLQGEFGGRAIDREVVLAAEKIIIHPRRMRPGDVDSGRNLLP